MALTEDPQLIKEAIRQCRKVIRFQSDELRVRNDRYRERLEELVAKNELLTVTIEKLTLLQGE